MQPYGQPYDQQPAAAPAVHVPSQQDFLSRVSHVRSEIRSLTADVQQIAGLHQRALAGSDPQAQQQLDGLVASTQLKNTSIRDQIRSLKADVERTTDGSAGLKKRQFDALNNDFKKELQGYLQEEQQYKERYRDQIARQYRIVNPDATETEVREAADRDWGNEGIFQTAVSRFHQRRMARSSCLAIGRESADSGRLAPNQPDRPGICRSWCRPRAPQ